MNKINNEEILIETKPKKTKLKLVFAFCIILFISFGGCFLYQKLSITEEDARENANRLFSMMTMDNLDNKLVGEIYPDFSNINNYIIFKHKCIITNISKNSDGDFEVYANYKLNANNIYPIFLIIGKENNKIIIKSSKGLCYAYYNKLLEYGKKRGCLVGYENDVEMSLIIKDKNLKALYDIDRVSKYTEIKKNIEVESNLSVSDFGYLTGNINLFNKNNFDLSSSDFDCELILYDSIDKVVHSQKIYFIGGLNSDGSASSSVMTSSYNSVKFNVKIKLNEEYGLSNKIETFVIQEASNNCR